MRTLEQYFKDNYSNHTIDFALRVYAINNDGSVTFYLHPSNKDGETPTFTVKGNNCERGGPGIIEQDDEQ